MMSLTADYAAATLTRTASRVNLRSIDPISFPLHPITADTTRKHRRFLPISQDNKSTIASRIALPPSCFFLFFYTTHNLFLFFATDRAQERRGRYRFAAETVRGKRGRRAPKKVSSDGGGSGGPNEKSHGGGAGNRVRKEMEAGGGDKRGGDRGDEEQPKASSV